MIEALYFQGPLGANPWQPGGDIYYSYTYAIDPVSEDMVYRVAKMMFGVRNWPPQTDEFRVTGLNTETRVEAISPGNLHLWNYFTVTEYAVLHWSVSAGWYWTPNCPSAETAEGYAIATTGIPADDFICRRNSIHITPKTETTGYVGCFATRSPAFFSEQETIGSTAALTIDYCAAQAAAAHYTYFGTYSPGECLGFNVTPPLRWQANTSECNTPCAGNVAQMCGGYSATQLVSFVSVYRMPDAPAEGDLGTVGAWQPRAQFVARAATYQKHEQLMCIARSCTPPPPTTQTHCMLL
ncbi:MAG: hypothetical protein J3K34DRAFT_408561 [Monoraphidium minutum]|nr:MAG: hypothetical protein J3K34DRAFT_408561 [Monoraphidium minutum]